MPKTKIVPKQLFENRNTSDVFPRLIIMGLLKILNKKLTYQQVWEDSSTGIQNVTVPFYFDFATSTNSEKFILDNYMHWTDDECTEIGMRKMDGDFKSLPYGVLTLESSSIEAGNITNRFVMGKYTKKVNGELRSYVAFLYSMPMTMNFNVNIRCESVNTMWKIEQAYREYFYKNKTFHVNYRGTVVSCRVGFPENISQTKTNTYTLGTAADSDIRLSFALACETYYPVFDPDSEQPAENTIKYTSAGIHINLDSDSGEAVSADTNHIVPYTHFEDGAIICTEEDVLIKWTFDYISTDLFTVDVMYKEYGEETLNLIESVENHNCYHLQILSDFVDNPPEIDIIIPNNEGAVLVNTPDIKVFPDPTDKLIKGSNARVVNKGFIITERDSIDAVLSYQVGDNYIDQNIKVNLSHNAVDPENPVIMEDAIYDKEINYRKIKLFLRDHNNPQIIVPLQDDDAWITVF